MEERLAGGNMNAVWKSGGSVRRPSGPWTPTIQRLLAHVRERGVTFAPEPFGIDDQGREMLEFLPGTVPAYPLDAWVWTDAMLVDAALRLRTYHDATIGFPTDGAIWRSPTNPPVEVICHNDFAPYNFVCRDRRLCGVIDFDMASPGSRIWDLSYLAYRLCPLAGPSNLDARNEGIAFPVQEQERRLALLLAAYRGPFTPKQIMATAIERLNDLATLSEQRALANSQFELSAHAALYRYDAAELNRRLNG